jgi:hypothetical protein
MTKKQELIDYVIGNEFITKPSLQEKFTYLLDEALTEQLVLYGVVKPLNFNINKALKIKSLGDLKRAYPDNKSHRVSSFGGYINYFVDGQLVYERKI